MLDQDGIAGQCVGVGWYLGLGWADSTALHMKAELITRFRDISPTGDGIELVVWRVPEPVPPTTHG